jgi:hypothetical protein
MALHRAADSDVHRDAMDDLVFTSKPPLGKQASSSHIVLPSHLQVEAKNESDFRLQMNSSQSCAKVDRKLATLTETFSATSEDNPLDALSLSEDNSFEVYEILPRHGETRRGIPALSLPASAAAAHQQTHWPISSYKSNKYNPPVQGPLAPVESLFTTTSSDSWDELNSTPREVSLLDSAESRDDEEEGYESGHDGDDECDGRVDMDQMQRMNTQFQRSNDYSPVGSNFRGSLPKFSHGPLSHLRDETKQKWIPDMSRTFQTSSSCSYVSPRSNVSQEDNLHSVGPAEKEKSFDQISIKERKGLFQSIKDKIFCVPGNYK